MASNEKYEPLRVRAWLRCGVVADRWLPLDGLLLYQAQRQRYGAQVSTVSGGSAISDNRTTMLPLLVNHGKQWYYHCSWAQWAPGAMEGADHWNKRFDNSLANLVDFGNRRGKVIIEAGQYKAYHMPLYYRVAEWVEWYCVGNQEKIGQLLSTCTHLGKKPAQGWGRVCKWEIESIPEDWSTWKDGELMRGVPAENVAGTDRAFNIAIYGIRPSYWRQSNQVPLVMPE